MRSLPRQAGCDSRQLLSMRDIRDPRQYVVLHRRRGYSENTIRQRERSSTAVVRTGREREQVHKNDQPWRSEVLGYSSRTVRLLSYLLRRVDPRSENTRWHESGYKDPNAGLTVRATCDITITRMPDIPENRAISANAPIGLAQLHPYGCGAACVAAAAQVEYLEAIAVLGEEKARQRGYYGRELVSGLKQLGKNYTFRHLGGKLRREIYQDGVIVFVRRSARYTSGHYLYRNGGRWMDPWMNISTSNLDGAKAGWRARLPGRAQYAAFPVADSIGPK